MITDAVQQTTFDAVLDDRADQPVAMLGGLTRRQMLKFCAGVAATMGLSQAAGVRMAMAAENPLRPPVIWLHGQECTGCTESLLRAYHPTLESLILDVISLDYHETLCVGAGKQALDYKHKIMEQYRGKYVLVTEGSTPMAEGGIYSKVGGKTQVDIVREAAEGAAAVIAIGSCASWGGVQSSYPNPTGAVGTHEVIPGKTVINVPGCPPNPYNFLSTVLHILTFGEPPALDEHNRPKFASCTRSAARVRKRTPIARRSASVTSARATGRWVSALHASAVPKKASASPSPSTHWPIWLRRPRHRFIHRLAARAGRAPVRVPQRWWVASSA